VRSKDVARLLIDTGAVIVRPEQPFVFASGMVSPIYCDNRILISLPKERGILLKHLYGLINDVAGMSWDVVAGVATSGIPFAAWVAMEYGKPMVYVREAAKDHGKKLNVEGIAREGQVSILIEDLITTGKSALSAVHALRACGVTCDNCFAIFNYEFARAQEAFAAQGVHLSTLTGFSALVEVLKERKALQDHELRAVVEWHQKESARP